MSRPARRVARVLQRLGLGALIALSIGCRAGHAAASPAAEGALEAATIFFADMVAWDGRLHPR
jgi:hypothetical protein